MTRFSLYILIHGACGSISNDFRYGLLVHNTADGLGCNLDSDMSSAFHAPRTARCRYCRGRNLVGDTGNVSPPIV